MNRLAQGRESQQSPEYTSVRWVGSKFRHILLHVQIIDEVIFALWPDLNYLDPVSYPLALWWLDEFNNSGQSNVINVLPLCKICHVLTGIVLTILMT